MRVEAAVEKGTKEVYRAKEFATLTGVTVRALHHYDRLGLLRPKQRSRAGYRLYSMRDFTRLEQIVVLKFLSIPLKQIRQLLESEANLPETLRRQQEVLTEKRRQLERAIRAISKARQAFQSRREPDWKLFQLIVREIEMQNKVEWKGKYFSGEAKAKVTERQKLWSPELQQKATRDWSDLYADVEACLGEDPAGPKAQALAQRWRKLLEQFTGGDPEIQKGLNAMWADSANWPADAEARKFVKPEVHEYIMKVFRVAK
jgi:MerR family transcriptional regulator, thiopeptide resistance regulator